MTMSDAKAKEARLIATCDRGPVTASTLMADLAALGVVPGMTILVHVSLRSLGWVCGGVQAVVAALKESVGADGTLVFPAYTGWNSDPAGWKSPPVPESWIPILRDAVPAFDPLASPTYGVGVLAEYFRTLPGVVRSIHPRASFAAWGKNAHAVVDGHTLDYPFGDASPLARAYDLDARVLMAGVTHFYVNSWYLSAFRARDSGLPEEACKAVVEENGVRVWKTYRDVKCKDNLVALGKAYEWERAITRGRMGYADAALIAQRDVVDFGVRALRSGLSTAPAP